jgi:hypothetical protein
MQMRVEAQPMEAKRKLARSEEFIPDTANEMIYDFGRFVSVYLNPRLIPLGFVAVCESFASRNGNAWLRSSVRR